MHWYVVKRVNVITDSIKVGDVIGFKQQNPNLVKITDDDFVPMADWIYIGKWEKPPIDELREAINLIDSEGGRL